MGVNLQQERFTDWLDEYAGDEPAGFLARLEKHIGRKIDPQSWKIADDAYPRVGSYTTYNIFRLCLEYVTRGRLEDWLDEDDDLEREALDEFSKAKLPRKLKIPTAVHFLDSGDTDTIFIPILFDRPFEYKEGFVASLPGATRALEGFAKGLGFQVTQSASPNGDSLAVATAKEVARMLYRFFTEKPDACVVVG